MLDSPFYNHLGKRLLYFFISLTFALALYCGLLFVIGSVRQFSDPSLWLLVRTSRYSGAIAGLASLFYLGLCLWDLFKKRPVSWLRATGAVLLGLLSLAIVYLFSVLVYLFNGLE